MNFLMLQKNQQIDFHEYRLNLQDVDGYTFEKMIGNKDKNINKTVCDSLNFCCQFNVTYTDKGSQLVYQ